MKALTVMTGLVLIGALGAGSLAAQDTRLCRTGKLVDLDTRTQTVGGMRSEHYEVKDKKNGKKAVDGNAYEWENTKVTYVLTVTVGDISYIAEHEKMLFFGYNPTDMVVNDPVNVCVEKNKLIFIRAGGKEYKTTIVRIERRPAEAVQAEGATANIKGQ